MRSGWYDRGTRMVRDLASADSRIYLEFEVRRVQCKSCGQVKREHLAFLADNPFYTDHLHPIRACFLVISTT